LGSVSIIPKIRKATTAKAPRADSMTKTCQLSVFINSRPSLAALRAGSGLPYHCSALFTGAKFLSPPSPSPSHRAVLHWWSQNFGLLLLLCVSERGWRREKFSPHEQCATLIWQTGAGATRSATKEGLSLYYVSSSAIEGSKKAKLNKFTKIVRSIVNCPMRAATLPAVQFA
jgi:hypothetical protein